MDRVRRSGADRADRRGVREQPRPQGGAGAHRGRARAGAARAVVPGARASTSRRRRRARASRGSTSPPLPPGIAGSRATTSASALERVLRARRLGQVPQRRAGRDQRPRRRRSTTARRCASPSPPTSRTRTSGCAPPTRELVVLEDTLKSRTDTVQLQRDRFDGGIIGEYDLRQAEAERSAVVADIARAQQAIGLLESALADADRPLAARGVHAGDRARRDDRGRDRGAAAAVRAAVGPARAAARHPARRSAARRVGPAHPAGARRTTSRALNLTGAYGTESAALSQPVHVAGRRSGASASGCVQPLLALKAIEAQVELATARRDRPTVEYPQTVQNAFREVHDALVANRSARDVLAAETDRRDQLRQALDVAHAALRRRPHVVSSKCSTRSARCSPRRRCASARRATRGCRSSTSRSRWAAAGLPSPTGRSNRHGTAAAREASLIADRPTIRLANDSRVIMIARARRSVIAEDIPGSSAWHASVQSSHWAPSCRWRQRRCSRSRRWSCKARCAAAKSRSGSSRPAARRPY